MATGEISAEVQGRIELAQKIADWVNENPSKRACVCILGSGDTTSAIVVGNHKLCVESTVSAMNTEETAVRQIVTESLILFAMSRVSEE